MITSDRQMVAAKEKMASLQASAKQLETDAKNRPLAKASRFQTLALIKELQNEISEYQELRESGIEAIKITELTDVMLVPIKYRIAKGMTQESFAKEVEMPLRMIARYESVH